MTGSQQQTAFRLRTVLLIGAVCISAWGARVAAHCQVPCGIYDDDGRIQMLLEDTRTIQKATVSIGQLAEKSDAPSRNQLTRWVITKDEHASHIIKTVSEYFLTQKVKTVAAGEQGYEEYLSHLADHHAVMVAAMRTKQKVSADAVSELQKAIETMAQHYTH
jgi:nickel superoxide dismutase